LPKLPSSIPNELALAVSPKLHKQNVQTHLTITMFLK